MRREVYSLQIISPCFAGGAEPEKQAEVRAPTIRGQLRWWFRVLGGFSSLSGMAVRAQEERIFGATAGGCGVASPLIVRTRQRCVSTVIKDADQLDVPVNSPEGYLLFPLRSNPKKGVYAGRGLFTEHKLPDFDLELVWRGSAGLWDDIRALACVFGHLGSLGFRSRRAMGALAYRGQAPDLQAALLRFAQPSNIAIRSLPASNSSEAVQILAVWLRKWRSYGRSPSNLNPFKAGFEFAKNDHDIAAKNIPGPAFRPALGLPIVSKYGDWNFGPGKPKGRFASPVLLRPHRNASGWRALVIFVDKHRWDSSAPAYFEGHVRPVSLGLYDAMREDALTNPLFAAFP